MKSNTSWAGLADKVVIVTGGAGILGAHICEAYIRAGAYVAVLDYDENMLSPLCEKLGGNAKPFVCDLSSEESVVSTVHNIIETFGRIDVLVNNAATKSKNPRDFFTPFENYSLETWREVMAVNIDGMFLMAREVGKQMLSQGAGCIVQTASIYGVIGADKRIYEGSDYLGGPINTPAVYSASKAAVIGLTKWLATHWGDKNIQVNCVVPGGVSSGQNSTFSEKYSAKVPLNRMATVDDIVPAFMYLTSDSAQYVTGHVLHVDGGFAAW